MTELVPTTQIEAIVGATRQLDQHLGRANSAEQRVYILHSHHCLDTTPDLRDCDYSLALDNGIDTDDWIEDQPVTLAIEDGHLTGRTRA